MNLVILLVFRHNMSYYGHMETINIAKLKQSLSEVVRRVRAGERFTIFDRKTAVAVLSAVEDRHIKVVSRASQHITAPRGLARKVKIDLVAMLRVDRDKR